MSSFFVELAVDEYGNRAFINAQEEREQLIVKALE